MNRVRQWASALQLWLAGKPRGVAAGIVVMALMLFAFVGSAVWFAFDVTAGLPSAKEIRGLGEMAQASTILDAGDKPAFTLFYKEQRIEVPFSAISPTLVKAVIATEDQRFYEHNGINLFRIAAAGLRNFRTGRRAEGGSTITQQLARQSFLTLDKTYRRKIKEILLAAQIEREFSKDQILELYLNKVYFGDGLYGVEAASRGYFGTHASDLTLDQAALLAGLIQSPSAYAPTSNPERAVARRNVVLQAMASTGAMPQADCDSARNASLHLTNTLEMQDTFGLYFKEQVRRELSERFGAARVAQGGLRVYTTIDTGLQQAAERAIEDGITSIENRRGYPHKARGKAKGTGYLQGALVAMEPQTGAVRAIVGGRDFSESRFNRATQARRQSGSAFKPFVYAAALEAGYSPASVISNLSAPITTAEGQWVPEDEHSNAASLTMRAALKISSNRAAVQMLNTIGIPNAVSYAQRLNVGTPPSVPSLALGAGDVTLLSMTGAYAAFAAQGMWHAPVFIRRVEDDHGHVLYQDPGKAQRAISAESAFLMSSMLADVINSGTAYKAKQMVTVPAAGKTGTTSDYMDAWFVGYTPHLVTGVWVGFDQPQTIINGGYAADLAVPIWGSFMRTATAGAKPDWFDKPDDIVPVTVCRVSGQLPNEGCSNVMTVADDGSITTKSMLYTDYFVKGNEPTTRCPVHTSNSILAATAPQSGAPASAGIPVRPSEPTAVGTKGEGGLPKVATIPTTTDDTAPGTVDKPKKPSKSFWRRIFGAGRGGG